MHKLIFIINQFEKEVKIMEKLLMYLVSKEIGFKVMPEQSKIELHLLDNYCDSDLAAVVEMVSYIYKKEGKIIIVIV
jgi:hypothetical protein